MTYPEADQIAAILAGAQRIVILQADNPDADSLGSALALENILGNLGKSVYLYCSVDVPSYLRYLPGWDRILGELPKQFDVSIIVDASTLTLFERLQTSGQLSWLAAKPAIVLDHHATVGNKLDLRGITLCSPNDSSTGEIVYHLARQLHWPLDITTGEYITTAILGDTQGLSNDLAKPDTYRAMAELVELGVSRPMLEERRREYGKMPVDIFHYKAALISRTEFTDDGRIASVDIPQQEITEYSPKYNPVPLIHGDMLSTQNVAVAIVFKHYDDGRITGSIRCNNGYAVADKLAEHLGGGGHPYASGFKIVHGRPFNEVKSECLAFAAELLNNLDKDHLDEALQYTHGQS
jgi:phosphoesterase RecJ-like protein